jgi:uncharacterized DUF497 family protein
MFEWDEVKRRSNLEKHGVDFSEIENCEWDEAFTIEDLRRSYGERRFIATVPLDNRLYVVVFVERNGQRRIISARKANAREVTFYEAQMDSSD